VRYFSRDEFDCQETGSNEMSDDFLIKLDELRHVCGFPFVITSGYRDPSHSIEAAKSKPGMHSTGLAADIAYSGGNQAYEITKNALRIGFTGIGVHKKFIHVDMRKTTPVMWCY
jgi:uncharacterized protein YcbK (DUF882 family)